MERGAVVPVNQSLVPSKLPAATRTVQSALGAWGRERERDIGRPGGAGLYVTHDQQEALAMANRVVLINGGWIERVAPPKRILLVAISR
jgi:ABC-type sulfate/molybdate transport systems ATPase subunit